MNLIPPKIEKQIKREIIENFIGGNIENAVANIRVVLDCMYAEIPAKKRISYGRFTTIKILAEKLFTEVHSTEKSILSIGGSISS